jgi:hypothetical protein
MFIAVLAIIAVLSRLYYGLERIHFSETTNDANRQT